jgi:hypothetical protein
MKWDEVRKCFPSQWVIIEAINAITKENRRIIEEVSVVDVFLNDSKNAMKKYLLLHKKNRMRELYVIHTSCNHLNIEIIPRINL